MYVVALRLLIMPCLQKCSCGEQGVSSNYFLPAGAGYERGRGGGGRGYGRGRGRMGGRTRGGSGGGGGGGDQA